MIADGLILMTLMVLEHRKPARASVDDLIAEFRSRDWTIAADRVRFSELEEMAALGYLSRSNRSEGFRSTDVEDRVAVYSITDLGRAWLQEERACRLAGSSTCGEESSS